MRLFILNGLNKILNSEKASSYMEDIMRTEKEINVIKKGREKKEAEI
jgi:hypothetical protein